MRKLVEWCPIPQHTRIVAWPDKVSWCLWQGQVFAFSATLLAYYYGVGEEKVEFSY